MAEPRLRSRSWANIRTAARSLSATASTDPTSISSKINATLPKGKDPMSVTLEEAVALDRREGCQGRHRQETVPQGFGFEGRRRQEARSQEAGCEEAGRQEKGLRPWRGGSPAQAPAWQIRRPQRVAERRLQADQGRHPQIHPREPRPLGQARDRQGVLAQGRRPHLAEGHAARPAGRGPADQGAQAPARAGSLPHVSVLEIYSRDADGGLLARPSEWNERFGEPPVVSLKPSRSGPAPGIGDRVLAKTFPSDEGEGPAYTGRVMKVFEKRAEAVLGVLRQADDGAFRIEPVERRQPEMIVARDDLNGAEKGDLVEVEQTSSARYGLPRARVIAGARLADQREGGLDDRHPRARDPAHLSGRRACRGRGGKAGDHGRPRGFSRPAAHHHRSGGRQGP